jgi:hypothetical protein
MDVEALFKARSFAFLRNSENVLALLEILADPLQDTSDAADFLLTAIDIDNSEGEQLDFLASLIGVTRPPLQETRLFTLVRLGEVSDPLRGFADDENPGGYMTTLEGLEAIDTPGDMSDPDFRYLIKQKAAAYRSIATHETLFLYLIAFGARCKVDGSTSQVINIDMDTYNDFDEWTRNYVETRGFKPGGFTVKILETSRHKEMV